MNYELNLDSWLRDLNTNFTLGVACLEVLNLLKILIQINTHIVVMVIYSILVDNILYLTVA